MKTEMEQARETQMMGMRGQLETDYRQFPIKFAISVHSKV